MSNQISLVAVTSQVRSTSISLNNGRWVKQIFSLVKASGSRSSRNNFIGRSDVISEMHFYFPKTTGLLWRHDFEKHLYFPKQQKLSKTNIFIGYCNCSSQGKQSDWSRLLTSTSPLAIYCTVFLLYNYAKACDKTNNRRDKNKQYLWAQVDELDIRMATHTYVEHKNSAHKGVISTTQISWRGAAQLES